MCRYVCMCVCAYVHAHPRKLNFFFFKDQPTLEGAASFDLVQGLKNRAHELGSEELSALSEAFLHGIRPGLAGPEHFDAVFVLQVEKSVATGNGV